MGRFLPQNMDLRSLGGQGDYNGGLGKGSQLSLSSEDKQGIGERLDQVIGLIEQRSEQVKNRPLAALGANFSRG